MVLNKTIADIRGLKIQGAVNIAIAAAKALNHVAQESDAKKKKHLLRELHEVKAKLTATRPTEPKMRNCLKFILNWPKVKTVPELKHLIREKTHLAISHLEENKDYVAHVCSEKIKNHMTVFTHCHSSTVVVALKHAKRKGRKFQVHNTETRPLFQGRITAKELAEAGIPVHHYVDSAAMLALKDADLMLIGSDAITAKGEVVNKIGSRLMAEAAEFYGVRVYVCTDSWDYDPETMHHPEKIEYREPSEVWERKPKGVRVINPAFEVIPPHLIAGIISELGVYKPEIFVHKVKRHYPWLR